MSHTWIVFWAMLQEDFLILNHHHHSFHASDSINTSNIVAPWLEILESNKQKTQKTMTWILGNSMSNLYKNRDSPCLSCFWPWLPLFKSGTAAIRKRDTTTTRFTKDVNAASVRPELHSLDLWMVKNPTCHNRSPTSITIMSFMTIKTGIFEA